MDGTEVIAKSREASKIFLASEMYKNAKCIMLYMPLGKETDTVEIMDRAFVDGKRLVFPVTDSHSGDITPYYTEKDTVFQKGAFSVMEPCRAEIADIVNVDVILVPGIAFSENGTRVGFGKGCYDRILKNTDAVKVGFCYEFQVCDEIVGEKHDVKMNYIVTECGIRKCL